MRGILSLSNSRSIKACGTRKRSRNSTRTPMEGMRWKDLWSGLLDRFHTRISVAASPNMCVQDTFKPMTIGCTLQLCAIKLFPDCDRGFTAVGIACSQQQGKQFSFVIDNHTTHRTFAPSWQVVKDLVRVSPIGITHRLISWSR